MKDKEFFDRLEEENYKKRNLENKEELERYDWESRHSDISEADDWLEENQILDDEFIFSKDYEEQKKELEKQYVETSGGDIIKKYEGLGFLL